MAEGIFSVPDLVPIRVAFSAGERFASEQPSGAEVFEAGRISPLFGVIDLEGVSDPLDLREVDQASRSGQLDPIQIRIGKGPQYAGPEIDDSQDYG